MCLFVRYTDEHPVVSSCPNALVLKVRMRLTILRLFSLSIVVVMSCGIAVSPALAAKTKKKKKLATVQETVKKQPRAKRGYSKSKTRKSAAAGNNFVAGGPWTEPTFADSTYGDNVDGEDLVVRRAAVEALGPLNGTVVVSEATTGRILTVVNQKVALKNGYQPCSTIKIVAALAGLSEGVINRDTFMRVGGHGSVHGGLDLTTALAKSNNAYFANIGTTLGYDKVAKYAKTFGLGEKAGLNIDGEQSGELPPGPPANGGMGMMTSFGEGIILTPLELTALVGAVANGGTLYYLQYPRTADDIGHFIPRVKRNLNIDSLIPEIKPGMIGAVEFGTARRANVDPNEAILGKTGTCTDRRTPTHLGWFSSFNDTGKNKLVVTVLLTGGRPINGPVASGVAGNVYRILAQQKYLDQGHSTSPVALISTPACCTR